MLSCCLTNRRALASDSIRHLDLHLCGFLYLSELLLMQPKRHSDRFCLTSFTAGVVESAGQQVLNTEPGSGHTFHSYSAFCWLHRCFRCGGDISYNNERAEVVFVLLGIALRPSSQLSWRHKIRAKGRNSFAYCFLPLSENVFVSMQPRYQLKFMVVLVFFCRISLVLCFNNTFVLIILFFSFFFLV